MGHNEQQILQSKSRKCALRWQHRLQRGEVSVMLIWPFSSAVRCAGAEALTKYRGMHFGVRRFARPLRRTFLTSCHFFFLQSMVLCFLGAPLWTGIAYAPWHQASDVEPTAQHPSIDESTAQHPSTDLGRRSGVVLTARCSWAYARRAFYAEPPDPRSSSGVRGV